MDLNHKPGLFNHDRLVKVLPQTRDNELTRSPFSLRSPRLARKHGWAPGKDLFTLYSLLFTLYSLLFTLYSLLFTLYSLLFTL